MGEEEDDERAELCRLACGDIPPGYCHVVDVEVADDRAWVWLLTNEAPVLERYEVQFVRRGGEWISAQAGGGFQTGTPEHVRVRAHRLEQELLERASRRG